MPNPEDYNLLEEIVTAPGRLLMRSVDIYDDISAREAELLTELMKSELERLAVLELKEPDRSYPFYHHGRTLLMEAAEHDAEFAIDLLTQYIDVNALDASGQSALKLTEQHAHPEADLAEETSGPFPKIGEKLMAKGALTDEDWRARAKLPNYTDIYSSKGKKTYHCYLYRNDEKTPLQEGTLAKCLSLLDDKEHKNESDEACTQLLRNILFSKDTKAVLLNLENALEKVTDDELRNQFLKVIHIHGNTLHHDWVVAVRMDQERTRDDHERVSSPVLREERVDDLLQRQEKIKIEVERQLQVRINFQAQLRAEKEVKKAPESEEKLRAEKEKEAKQAADAEAIFRAEKEKEVKQAAEAKEKLEQMKQFLKLLVPKTLHDEIELRDEKGMQKIATALLNNIPLDRIKAVYKECKQPEQQQMLQMLKQHGTPQQIEWIASIKKGSLLQAHQQALTKKTEPFRVAPTTASSDRKDDILQTPDSRQKIKGR